MRCEIRDIRFGSKIFCEIKSALFCHICFFYSKIAIFVAGGIK